MTDFASQPPAEDDDRAVLTNRQGHQVYDNQNSRTVGARGPATLENYQFLVDDELGARVGEGLGISLAEVKDLPPLASQTLSEDELARLKNLGDNGPRDVQGLTMTHCVPNEHVVVSR